MGFVPDTPAASGGRFVPDAPATSPYTGVIADSVAFNQRAAANTPEAIGRQATLDTDALTGAAQIPVGVGGLTLRQDIARPVLENAPRVGIPLGVGLSLSGVGALPGAAILAASGAAGELGSQVIENQLGDRANYSLPQIGTSAILSAVPQVGLARVASPVVRGAIRTAEGAALGGAQPIVESALEGKLPEAAQVGRGALFGAALGAPFGALEAAAGRTGAAAAQQPKNAGAQVLDAAAAETPSLANKAAIGAKNAEGNLTQLQQQINATAMTPPPAQQSAEVLSKMVQPAKSAEDSANAILAAEAERTRLSQQFAEAQAEQLQQQLAAQQVAGGDTVTLAGNPTQNRLTMLETRPGEAIAERARLAQIDPVTEQRIAPAEYVGVQEGLPASEGRPAIPDIELYNLTEDIPGHPVGSTVSRATLEQNGFVVPEPPAPVAAEPSLSAQAQRMQDQYGRVNPGVLAPIAGGGAGAAYGITQGDTPEQRLKNAALYGSIGLASGIAGGAVLNKVFEKPIRQYKSPELQKVARMLTPEEQKTSLFEKLADEYGNFRYRLNTRAAPIGDAQRGLYKLTGRDFTPGSYYDLERGIERLAGAPVQAEAEVAKLQAIVDQLPKEDVPHLDTYLTLSRIEDRLIKTGEENDRLLDNVGRAEADLDAAIATNKASPGVRNAGAVVAKRDALRVANEALESDFNRKRVGDWSVADARQGLADLQSSIGPQAYGRLQQAGQEYQNVMKGALQTQVDAGRMSQDLMDRVLASNDFYAPFKVLKYFEDEEPFVKGGGAQRIPSAEQLAKKITGIDDTDVRIGSPTNVAAEQVYKGYVLAQKNRKLREIATLSRLDKNGDYVRLLGEGEKPRQGYEAVGYFVNGQPRRMEVDRKIADALNGVGIDETDIIMRGLGKFSSAFKLGATGLSIPFNIANAGIFDPLRLATISKYGFKGPQDFLYTLYEWPRALWSSARGNLGVALGGTADDLYETWMKSGAAGSTLARVMTPEAFGARLPRQASLGELVTGENSIVNKMIKPAALISNTLEETTKLLGLQRAMRLERLDKLTPAQLEQKWPEIVTELRNYAGSPDFSRAGVSMKPLNILLPFTNARWQGALADTARLNPFSHGNAKDAGAAWVRLGTVVALPAAALMAYNLSTPQNEADFNQIPQQERERYFHFPLNMGSDGKPTILDTGKGYYFKNKDGVNVRGYYRIPKREFPGLVANTMEDFIQYVKGRNPESFAKVAGNLLENTASTISPLNIEGRTIEQRAISAASGLNPALRVPLEVGLNKDFFTGREIVPEGRQKASPELQYSEATPDVYKRAAAALPDALPNSLRSPADLQHIVEGFTGGVTRQFAPPKLSPGNPAADSSPLLGRFYRSERIENEDLLQGANAAETARADQRIRTQESAAKFAEHLAAEPTPEGKQKLLADAARVGLLTPEFANDLKGNLEDAARGLNYEDRVVKRSYSVAGGFRAKYYLDKMQNMTPKQTTAYWQDQAAKGLLTPEVVQQMAQSMKH